MAKKGFKITIHGVADYHTESAGEELANLVAEKMESFLNDLEVALNPKDENDENIKIQIKASGVDNVYLLGHGNEEYPEVIR